MALPEIDKQLATELVRGALHEVADFPDNADISAFTFQHFHDYHKKVFASALKLQLNNTKDNNYYYDLLLNEDLFNSWSTINDCIDYVVNENIMLSGPTGKVTL